MFILYGIKFNDDKEIHYTTQKCFKEWSGFGAFKIVKKQLILDLFNKTIKINLF